MSERKQAVPGFAGFITMCEAKYLTNSSHFIILKPIKQGETRMFYKIFIVSPVFAAIGQVSVKRQKITTFRKTKKGAVSN